MQQFELPGIGVVHVTFQTFRFGTTATVVKIVDEVRWPDGRTVSCEVDERVAQYWDALQEH